MAVERAPILKTEMTTRLDLCGAFIISDEMESDEHQKRIPVETLQQMLQLIGFQKSIHRRFELGLNHPMVASR